MLIIIGVSIVSGIVQYLLQFIVLRVYGLPLMIGVEDLFRLSFDEIARFFIVSNVVTGIVKMVSNFLLIPLMILFCKNMYLAWKGKKK